MQLDFPAFTQKKTLEIKGNMSQYFYVYQNYLKRCLMDLLSGLQKIIVSSYANVNFISYHKHETLVIIFYLQTNSVKKFELDIDPHSLVGTFSIREKYIPLCKKKIFHQIIILYLISICKQYISWLQAYKSCVTVLMVGIFYKMYL